MALAELDKFVEFKEPACYWNDKPVRHLGCFYTVARKKDSGVNQITSITSSMKEYFEDIVARFEERTGETVRPVPTPLLYAGAEKRYGAEAEHAYKLDL